MLTCCWAASALSCTPRMTQHVVVRAETAPQPPGNPPSINLVLPETAKCVCPELLVSQSRAHAASTSVPVQKQHHFPLWSLSKVRMGATHSVATCSGLPLLLHACQEKAQLPAQHVPSNHQVQPLHSVAGSNGAHNGPTQTAPACNSRVPGTYARCAFAPDDLATVQLQST